MCRNNLPLCHDSQSPVSSIKDTPTKAVDEDILESSQEIIAEEISEADFEAFLSQSDDDESFESEILNWSQPCACFCDTLKGGKSKNEDSVCKFQSHDGRITATGVFDGHGLSPFAIAASKVGVKLTTAWFNQYANDMPEWSDARWREAFNGLFNTIQSFMRDQFALMERRQRQEYGTVSNVPVVDSQGVVRHADGKAVHGGTTASISVVVRTATSQRLITAHVGDSDVIQIQNDSYQVLTNGHRALNVEEFNRIRDLPDALYPDKLLFVYDVDRVRDSSLLPKVFLNNGQVNSRVSSNPCGYGLYPSNIRQEPAAYAVTPSFIHHDKVKLANTRALGDFYGTQFGLTHEPEISFKDLPINQTTIIVSGSDGIWDIWEYADVMTWFSQWKQVPEEKQQFCLQQFLTQTKQRAASLFQSESSVDDSSSAVIVIPQEFEIPSF